MKIHLLGASGSGTTTLGCAIAEKFDWLHLDADDYYWVKTTPPFQEKVAPAERNNRMIEAFEAREHVVVSGSMFSWGEYWKSAFDLIIFLYVPPAERMKRLKARELKRYGVLLKQPDFAAQSEAFLEWAAGYDSAVFTGRSLKLHNQWLEEATCPVLRLEGSDTIADNLARVSTALSRN